MAIDLAKLISTKNKVAPPKKVNFYPGRRYVSFKNRKLREAHERKVRLAELAYEKWVREHGQQDTETSDSSGEVESNS